MYEDVTGRVEYGDLVFFLSFFPFHVLGVFSLSLSFFVFRFHSILSPDCSQAVPLPRHAGREPKKGPKWTTTPYYDHRETADLLYPHAVYPVGRLQSICFEHLFQFSIFSFPWTRFPERVGVMCLAGVRKREGRGFAWFVMMHAHPSLYITW